MTCWYLSQAEAFDGIFLPLRQLQRLKTMNIYIDDLTNYSSDGCLQSRHDTGAHSSRAIGSFRWTKDFWLRWAEVIRRLVLQDKIPKTEIKFEDWSSRPSIVECDRMLSQRNAQHVETHDA